MAPTGRHGKRNKLFGFLTGVFAVLMAFKAAGDSHKVITLGAGLSKPPYIIADENRGLELDVARRAFEIAGYQVNPVYLPLKRIFHSLKFGKIDAGLNFQAGSPSEFYLSDVVMTYQNVGVSRTSQNLKVKSIIDLAGHHVVAFQNAYMYLGQDYRNAVGHAKTYKEIADQANQVKMLLAKRADILVMDFRIFLHFQEKLQQDVDPQEEFTFHKIFKPTPYHVGMKDEALRDAFNQGLRVLIESGEYQDITDRYLDVSSVAKVKFSISYN